MTPRTLILKTAVLTIVLAGAACVPGPAGRGPDPVLSYSETLTSAAMRVDSGDYAGADRILSNYALRGKGSDRKSEIAFWRALYMIDPNNRGTSMADGVRALDMYLSNPGAKQYRAQALVLKRTAQTVIALRTAQQTPHIVGRDTVFVTREDEIAALKEQLAKANAELERIKKRLANPSR